MTEPTDPKAAEITTAEKPARKRRTKAEIEAANAAEDSAKPKRGGRRPKADDAVETSAEGEAASTPVAPSTPPEEIHRRESSLGEQTAPAEYDRPPASVQEAPARQEGGGQPQHPQQGGGNYQRRFDKFRFRDRRPQQGGGQQGGGNGVEANRGPQVQGGQRDRNDRGDRGDRGDRRDGGDQSGAQVYERDPNQPIEYSEGILELSGKGFGFLREAKRQFAQHPLDTFVTPEVCRRFNLRDGMWIKGETRRSNRGPQM